MSTCWLRHAEKLTSDQLTEVNKACEVLIQRNCLQANLVCGYDTVNLPEAGRNQDISEHIQLRVLF